MRSVGPLGSRSTLNRWAVRPLGIFGAVGQEEGGGKEFGIRNSEFEFGIWNFSCLWGSDSKGGGQGRMGVQFLSIWDWIGFMPRGVSEQEGACTQNVCLWPSKFPPASLLLVSQEFCLRCCDPFFDAKHSKGAVGQIGRGGGAPNVRPDEF